MSRSALTRGAQLKAMRAQETQDVPQEASERRVKNDELPVHGSETTYNLNTLLHQNILQSDYFHSLYKFKTYHEVVDEIYYRVEHAEPLSPGTARIPSTCFCLLMKFFLMRLTVKQMQGLLRHTDSPYIRVVGFLYLRYTSDPEELWKWFEPYLDDPEEFNASANPSIKTTIGEWLVGLLEEQHYFGTILPRIPKKIQDDIKVKLLLHDRKKERAKANLAIVDQLKPGTKIRAMYADEDNEPAMYEAVIDSVEENNKFWVTFPEYGNSEKVSLGDIEFAAKKPRGARSASRSRSAARDRSRSRSRESRRDNRRSHRGSRSRRDRSQSRSRTRRRSRSRSRSVSRDRRRRSRRSRSRSAERSGVTTEDLLQQVRERERRKAEAVGRDYAARPASYKGSLSLKLDRYTTRKRSKSPVKRAEVVVVSSRASAGNTPSSSPRRHGRARDERGSPGRETEQMRKLRDMYGDASTKKAHGDDE